MKYFVLSYKLCSALGLVPLFNFKKQKLLLKYQIILTPLYLTFYTALITGLILLHVPRIMEEPIELMHITEIIDYAIFVQMPAVSAVIMFFNLRKWETFINTCYSLHRSFGNFSKNHHKTHLFIFVIFFTLPSSYIIVDIFQDEFKEASTLYDIWYSLTTNGELHWLCLGINCNISLHFLKTMYKNLRLIIEEDCEKGVEEKFTCAEKKIIYRIKLFKKWHKQLFQMVAIFNHLYGWFMLSNLIIPLVNSIDLMEFLIEEPTEFNYLEFLSVDVSLFLNVQSFKRNSRALSFRVFICIFLEHKKSSIII